MVHFEVTGDKGFAVVGKKPWWTEIDWVQEKINRHATRSFKNLLPDTKHPHAGFLWEAVRRLPELQELLEARNTITARDLEGKNLLAEGMSPGEAIAVLAARSQAKRAFTISHGLEVYDALRVLCDNWRNDFESLVGDDKKTWLSSYQAFWHEIGTSGSVPALPVDLPTEGPDVGKFYGQGITAFDLLIEAQGGGPIPASDFIDRPLPALALESFAMLTPPVGENGKVGQPTPDTTGKFGEPDSYPWVSFGILRGHLKKNHLYPLVLAINLEKDNETIVRDLMEIVKRKRRFLGLAVGGRKIRMESFEKIRALDKEVLHKDGKPPLSETIKRFEKSAQLDLRPLIDAMKGHLRSHSVTSDNANHYQQAFGLLTGRPLPESVRAELMGDEPQPEKS